MVMIKKPVAVVWAEAVEAGSEAVEKLNVRPMVVVERKSCLDDKSEIVKSWYVEDGACGFAWVNIRPASKRGLRDCEMVGYLKKNNKGSYSEYDKCWQVWIYEYNQSMQKKEAYADAVAEVLREYGIDANSGSRMD